MSANKYMQTEATFVSCRRLHNLSAESLDRYGRLLQEVCWGLRRKNKMKRFASQALAIKCVRFQWHASRAFSMAHQSRAARRSYKTAGE